MIIARQHAEFLTVTCLEWTHVLKDDRFKNIVIDSLRFLTIEDRIRVYGFVIMPACRQMLGDHKRDDVQRDFLKFTSQQILKVLRNEKSDLQEKLLVQSKDRKYQVWERNSLGTQLWSPEVFWQKLDYLPVRQAGIHYNPVKANLCECPEDYRGLLKIQFPLIISLPGKQACQANGME